MVHNTLKKVTMHPKAREAIKSFPEDVKDKLGQALFDVQRGEKLVMPQSRPMPSVAIGVKELRVRGQDGIYRAFYYAKDKRGIFVFHAFVKKAQKTTLLEVELGKKRLRELLNAKG